MTENPFKPTGQVTMFAEPTQSHVAVTPEMIQLARQNQTAVQSKSSELFSSITSFDWRKIPPPIMVEILKQTPQRGKTGEPDYFLKDYQAWRFAIRAYELDLSPLSTEVWYNSQNNMTNVTFEGKLKLARLNNLQLGPPQLERMPADPALPLVAYKCTINSPSGPSTYVASLKEWKMNSPVWRDRPDHMLQIRAAEKCLSFASGIGTSELMGEPDLQIGPEAAAVMGEVVSTDFTAVPTKGDK